MSPKNPGIVESSSKSAPLAPTIGAVTDQGSGRTYNNGSVSVAFTAPSFDGKLPVTGYTVTSSPQGLTGTGSSSPISVTGLNTASSSSYTFTVTATNAAGTSAASSASSSVTPTAKPQAPTIGTASGGTSGVVSVPFTAGENGNSTVTVYTATSSSGITATASSSPIAITESSAGTYTYTVTATNANGTSPASAASNGVVSTFGPFFPPFFPFFPPFFPPYFPFFPPFFPPYFPYFPFFPFFPPFFPPSFGPYFPPKFPAKCVYAKSKVLTANGYVNAEDVKVGDILLTVSPDNMTNTETLLEMTISNNVNLVEVEVISTTLSQKELIKFNGSETLFSHYQPIFVKSGENIEWKNTGDVVVGDMLVNINPESGDVTYTTVDTIEILGEEDVYDIRTANSPWFIVGDNLIVC